MTISNYTNLKTAIVAWGILGTSMDTIMDDILIMANDMLNNGLESAGGMIPALRVREMEAVSSLTPSSGVCTLPTDYLQYRRVVEKASIRRPLDYITPEAAEDLYPTRSSGLSNKFTIIGASLYMYPLSSNDIELTYYQKIPDITVSNTTNWLLTKRPAIYLHACLFQVGVYRRDAGMMQRSGQILASLCNSMADNDVMANYAYAPSTIHRMTVA